MQRLHARVVTVRTPFRVRSTFVLVVLTDNLLVLVSYVSSGSQSHCRPEWSDRDLMCSQEQQQ